MDYEQNAKSALVGTIKGLDRRMTILESLQSQKESLIARLSEVNSAIESLESNPQAASMLESLRKVQGLF